jgi:beta-glucosidase
MVWFEEPGLRFAVGFEDTFIPQESPGRRKLDEYEITQHNQFWHDDLGRAAETGATIVRWGIPWYRIQPAPDAWDFSWLDRVVARFAELGLTPIVDLMHYGTPLWLDNEFVNASYPERVAEYAAKVAERYADTLAVFTPLNEPFLNVVYCGADAEWPPYLRGDDGFVTVLGQIAKGIALTQSAITEVLGSRASFVHVEAASRYADPPGTHAEELGFLRRRALIVEDLVTGLVDADHPLAPWLSRHGLSDDALTWHREHHAIPDVMGVNYYPMVSTEVFETGASPAGTVGDPRRRVNDWTDGLDDVLRKFAERYGRPVMLTETSVSGTEEYRARWLDDSVAHVRALKEQGFPIVGYTWWAVTDWFEWNYRNESAPAETYFTNQGLWSLRPDSVGVMERVRTPLVDRFRGHAVS